MKLFVDAKYVPPECLRCIFLSGTGDLSCILQSEEANSMALNFEELKKACPLVELPFQESHMEKAMQTYLDIRRNPWLSLSDLKHMDGEPVWDTVRRQWGIVDGQYVRYAKSVKHCDGLVEKITCENGFRKYKPPREDTDENLT